MNTKPTDMIGLYVRNVFKEGELDESATTEDSSAVRRDGIKRLVNHYKEPPRTSASSAVEEDKPLRTQRGAEEGKSS